MPKKSKKSEKSPHEKLLTKLANYEKKSYMLGLKPPSNARMKLRKYTPVKKHAISLKSLIQEYESTPRPMGFIGPISRRPKPKLTAKLFSAYNPADDETADFLKSKGLGYRRKRKGYY